jgi:cytochrome P450
VLPTDFAMALWSVMLLRTVGYAMNHGGGRHSCLGAALARLQAQMEVAPSALPRRYPLVHLGTPTIVRRTGPHPEPVPVLVITD